MKAWTAWVDRLDRRESGTPLALVRIFVGLTVLWDLGGTWSSGALAFIWGDVRDTPLGYRQFALEGLWTVLGTRYDTVRAVTALTMGAAALLTLGAGARVAAFVTLQGCIALFRLNLLAGGGHDHVATNALWLLVLADSGRTLSLRARLRTGSWRDDTPVASWPRELLILQLVVMYTVTGMQKMAGEWFPWGDLLAVHNMLLKPVWARWDLSPYLVHLGPLTRAATMLTWVWEVSFPIAGFAAVRGWRRVRTGYAVIGAGFHLTLLVVANLGPFSLITLSLYPALFAPTEWPFLRRTSAS